MDLQTLANLAAVGAGATAPFAIWYAAKQTSLAHRQFNRDGGIRVEVHKAAHIIQINNGPAVSPSSVKVHLEGPGERHNLEIALRVGNAFRILKEAPTPLTSSSEPVIAKFDLTPKQEKEAFLIVTWVAEDRYGLVPQAVRFELLKDGEFEYWKWNRVRHAWFRVFHHRFPKLCNFSLGKWCKSQTRPYSSQNLPSWPLGLESKKLGELQKMPPELR